MRLERPWLWLVGAVLTAGCQSMPVVPLPPQEPVVRVVTQEKIIHVSCVDKIPDEPMYPASPEALAKLSNDFSGAWDGVALLKGEIAIRAQDQKALRDLLQGCLKPP